jgi:carboxyl-terminal processing protease
MMKRLISILLVVVSNTAFALPADTVELKAKPVYGKEARVISYILDNNHYRKIKLNDSLSAAILDRYIKELDNSKSYFLASDIKSFDRYKFAIDDLTRNENVNPAFNIYKVFSQRYKESFSLIFR